MNINHTFQYLQMGLPERINRKKLFGDFEGALQDMESYLLTPDLPDAMRHCLTTEAVTGIGFTSTMTFRPNISWTPFIGMI